MEDKNCLRDKYKPGDSKDCPRDEYELRDYLGFGGQGKGPGMGRMGM